MTRCLLSLKVVTTPDIRTGFPDSEAFRCGAAHISPNKNDVNDLP